MRPIATVSVCVAHESAMSSQSSTTTAAAAGGKPGGGMTSATGQPPSGWSVETKKGPGGTELTHFITACRHPGAAEAMNEVHYHGVGSKCVRGGRIAKPGPPPRNFSLSPTLPTPQNLPANRRADGRSRRKGPWRHPHEINEDEALWLRTLDLSATVRIAATGRLHGRRTTCPSARPSGRRRTSSSSPAATSKRSCRRCGVTPRRTRHPHAAPAAAAACKTRAPPTPPTYPRTRLPPPLRSSRTACARSSLRPAGRRSRGRAGRQGLQRAHARRGRGRRRHEQQRARSAGHRRGREAAFALGRRRRPAPRAARAAAPALQQGLRAVRQGWDAAYDRGVPRAVRGDVAAGRRERRGECRARLLGADGVAAAKGRPAHPADGPRGGQAPHGGAALPGVRPSAPAPPPSNNEGTSDVTANGLKACILPSLPWELQQVPPVLCRPAPDPPPPPPPKEESPPRPPKVGAGAASTPPSIAAAIAAATNGDGGGTSQPPAQSAPAAAEQPPALQEEEEEEKAPAADAAAPGPLQLMTRCQLASLLPTLHLPTHHPRHHTRVRI